MMIIIHLKDTKSAMTRKSRKKNGPSNKLVSASSIGFRLLLIALRSAPRALDVIWSMHKLNEPTKTLLAPEATRNNMRQAVCAEAHEEPVRVTINGQIFHLTCPAPGS